MTLINLNVHLLLTATGKVVRVYSAQADAERTMLRFNADPWIAEGQPDPDAPYSVETWAVKPWSGET